MGFSIKPDAGALLEMVKLQTMEFVQEIYVFTEVHTIFLAEDVIWEIIRDEAVGH